MSGIDTWASLRAACEKYGATSITVPALVDAIESSIRVEAWDQALRWVRQQADVTSPEYVLERIDRAEPFNPYRAARPTEGES